MAFNASGISSRYSAAGVVAVLKSDWTKMCDDLIALETFAATGGTNQGRFSQLLLAEQTATPGTNIELFHLDTNSLASSTEVGKWRSLQLGTDRVVAPATNINLSDLNTSSLASTATNGTWKQLILDKTVQPGTNIAINDLKQILVTSVTATQSFAVSNWNSIGSNPTTDPGGLFSNTLNTPYYLTTQSIGADSGGAKFYMMGFFSTINNSDSRITMGAMPQMAAVLISGALTIMPIVTYFGTTGGSSGCTITTVMKMYQISET